jgi:hypothetical protein
MTKQLKRYYLFFSNDKYLTLNLINDQAAIDIVNNIEFFNDVKSIFTNDNGVPKIIWRFDDIKCDYKSGL